MRPVNGWQCKQAESVLEEPKEIALKGFDKRGLDD